MSACLLCGKPVDDGPFSVCYDPEWKVNCWGGDTHQVVGLLCDPCGENVASQAGMEEIQVCVKEENQPVPLRSVKEIMSDLKRPSPLGSDDEIVKILQAKGVRPMMTPDDCVEAMFS